MIVKVRECGGKIGDPAARFLMAKGNTTIKSLTEGIWNIHDDGAYEKVLDVLIGEVADYVESTPELRNTPTEDMWDFRNSEEDVDDEY